jgi:hypothetical protein
MDRFPAAGVSSIVAFRSAKGPSERRTPFADFDELSRSERKATLWKPLSPRSVAHCRLSLRERSIRKEKSFRGAKGDIMEVSEPPVRLKDDMTWQGHDLPWSLIWDPRVRPPRRQPGHQPFVCRTGEQPVHGEARMRSFPVTLIYNIRRFTENMNAPIPFWAENAIRGSWPART